MSKAVFIIISISLLLRVLFLDSVPQGLSALEGTIGWRVQNLLAAGTDEFGRPFPLIFSNLTDLEMPIATYVVLPFLVFDPTSVFLLRLPFALLGTLSVAGGIILARKLSPKYAMVGLWVGILLAISPWTLWLSRSAQPAIVGLTLLIWGVYFSLFDDKRRWLGLGLLTLVLVTLKSAVLFMVPFSIACYLFNRKIIPLVGVLLMSLVVIYTIITFSGGLKPVIEKDFSFFTNTPFVDNVNFYRGQDENAILGKVLHNKSYLGIRLLENYLNYLNPSYIFARGDTNSLHNPSNFGLLLTMFLPFFFYGLYKIYHDKTLTKNLKIFLISWFLLAPLPGLFLDTVPDSSRVIFIGFPLMFVIAFGLSALNKRFVPIVGLFIVYSLSVVIFDVWTKEPIRQSGIWQSSLPQVAQFVQSHPEDLIWLTDKVDPNPGPSLAFYTHQLPANTNLPKRKEAIYRAWVSRVHNVMIGDSKTATTSTQNFRFIIATPEELKMFGIISEYVPIHEIGEYVIVEKQQQPTPNKND